MDCAALAEVLDESAMAISRPEAWGEPRLLRRYERRRKSENLLAAAAMDGLERLFAIDNPLVSRLRGASLSAVNRLPFVKREMAMRAMGLRGDVPAYLKPNRRHSRADLRAARLPRPAWPQAQYRGSYSGRSSRRR